MIRKLVLLAPLVLLATVTPSRAQDPQDRKPESSKPSERDLAGVYRCEGVNPDGRTYRGVVEISKDDKTYRVRWTLGQGGTSVGVGMVQGDVLAVSYYTGQNVGLVMYRIDKGIQLTGEWAVLGADGQLRPETLTKVGMQVLGKPSEEPLQITKAGP